MRRGDVVLVHSPGILGWLIRLGERMRGFGGDAYWNHVAVAVSAVNVVEARWPKVRKDREKWSTFRVCRPLYTDGEAEKVASFAERKVGVRYSLRDIGWDAVWCLTGWKFGRTEKEALICSQLATQSLRRAGFSVPSKAPVVTPADVARFLCPS